ncbi:MAG: peptide/nickel transport system permease protein [Gaiellales bacterium]|nr:peptide/nickel transport system permease protein [Gaiellales bacterium]
MIGYLARRAVQATLVVFGVTLLVFILSHIIPGGAARAALGPRASSAQIQQFNKLNGYDLPIWQQFYEYCRGLVLHFNLGYSYKKNEGVSALIQDALPKTLVLVGISTLAAVITAVPLGVLQVVRRNKPIDYILTGTAFIFYAMPAFLLGQLLILYFAIELQWFSTEAPQTGSIWGILSHPLDLVLPVLSLAAITIAAFSRYMRSSMMEAMTEDYVRTAKAKGASQRRVLYRHALRNALIPLITLLGLSLPAIVGGALITETVFNFPGMGLLTTQAAINNDVPLLLGTTFVAALATVVGSLLADVLYAIVDPRVRYA